MKQLADIIDSTESENNQVIHFKKLRNKNGLDKKYKRISIILPAFNEKDGIENTILQLKETMESSGLIYEVIVVDDGSTDDTLNQLVKHNWIKIIQHPKNLGYGAALKTGILHAKYEIVAISDVDGTYPNQLIPMLFEQIQKCDMVVGSRNGSKVKMPLLRRPAKWFIGKLANYLAGTKIPDINSGLRIIRKDLVQRYLKILPNGYSFTTTITLASLSNGHKVTYIPIDYYGRVGKSKIRPFYDTVNFVQLIVRTILLFNPLKVFVPFSLILMGCGCLTLLYRFIYGGGLGTTSVILFMTGIQILSVGMIADLIDRRLR